MLPGKHLAIVVTIQRIAVELLSIYDKGLSQLPSSSFNVGANMKVRFQLTQTIVVVALFGLILTAGCNKNEETADSLGTNSSASGDAEESTSTPFPVKDPSPDSGFKFEVPVRIKAGGEYVSAESPGYACPTLADVDGDGKLDLVVGQFNQGHMQFCKNVSEDEASWEFSSPQWLMTGDEKAVVPGVW